MKKCMLNIFQNDEHIQSLDLNDMTDHLSTRNNPMILLHLIRMTYTVKKPVFLHVLNLVHAITDCILFEVRASSFNNSK